MKVKKKWKYFKQTTTHIELLQIKQCSFLFIYIYKVVFDIEWHISMMNIEWHINIEWHYIALYHLWFIA